MIELTELQKATVREVQQHGADNPITGKDIANAIGLKPRSSGKEGADMRSIINALRVKGYPICAHGNGYFWAQSKQELQGFIEGFQGRIDKQQEACDGMRQAFDKVGGELPKEAEKSSRWIVPQLDGTVRPYNVPDSRLQEFKTKFPNARRM